MNKQEWFDVLFFCLIFITIALAGSLIVRRARTHDILTPTRGSFHGPLNRDGRLPA
jgi:hypothetical protein